MHYAEGFGWSRTMPILFEHAWCVDAQGKPVEVTLRKGLHDDLRYFGIVLKRSFLEWSMRAGSLPPFFERQNLQNLELLPRDDWWNPISAIPAA